MLQFSQQSPGLSHVLEPWQPRPWLPGLELPGPGLLVAVTVAGPQIKIDSVLKRKNLFIICHTVSDITIAHAH